jgi:hypothetical protein
MGGSVTALLVAVNFSGLTPMLLASRTVKVGTRTMTSLGSIPILTNSVFAPVGWTELFGIINPPTGAQSIFVTCGLAEQITGSSVAYNGAASFGAAATSANLLGNSHTLPPVIGPPKGVAVAAFSVTTNQTLTAGAGSTLRWRGAAAASLAIEDVLTTGGSVSMSMSASGLATWSGVVVPVVSATIASINYPVDTVSIAPRVTPTASVTLTVRGGAALSAAAAVTASATAVTSIGPKTAAAALAVTAARPAAAISFTPLPPTTAVRVVTATATADIDVIPAPAAASSSPLRYVGRHPDYSLLNQPQVVATSIVPRSYVVTANSTTALTTSFLNQAIGSRTQYLATTAFINQESAKRAAKTNVTAADANYFPATGHGLAVTDATGKIPASALPSGLVTNRIATYYSCSGASISAPTRVTTANPTELLIGTVTVTDPGWAWTPLVFAYVKGYDRVGASPTRWVGTGVADAEGRILVNNVGILTVKGSNGTVYGSGQCTASTKDTYSPVLPAATGTPTPLSGALTFSLYGSCRNGAGRTGEGYTFTGSDLIFYVIAMPAG